MRTPRGTALSPHSMASDEGDAHYLNCAQQSRNDLLGGVCALIQYHFPSRTAIVVIRVGEMTLSEADLTSAEPISPSVLPPQRRLSVDLLSLSYAQHASRQASGILHPSCVGRSINIGRRFTRYGSLRVRKLTHVVIHYLFQVLSTPSHQASVACSASTTAFMAFVRMQNACTAPLSYHL